VGSLPQGDEGTRQTRIGVICTSVNIPYSGWCSSFQAESKWVSTRGPVRGNTKALLSPSVKWIDDQEVRDDRAWMALREAVDLVYFESRGPGSRHPTWRGPITKVLSVDRPRKVELAGDWADLCFTLRTQNWAGLPHLSYLCGWHGSRDQE
jgi:hypothetical protein